MKVSELIQSRQPQWVELEVLCETLSNATNKPDVETISKFSNLYRSACADLALAEAYQLPPNTVDYLHRLVARAHNQLYRSRSVQWSKWAQRILTETPRAIFCDPCVHIATAIFWGLFLLSAFLAYDDATWPNFAEQVVGEQQLDGMRDMYNNWGEGRNFGTDGQMFGFYVNHNASIGISCFVTMLFVLPGLVTLAFNAIQLGTVFGFMFRGDMGEASVNFQNFVTAHGPFELTAIVLSAGAGLKIGLSWVMTKGLSRRDSLVAAGREALPIAMCAVVLFCMAAVIEGFVSPTEAGRMPWAVKGVIAVCCTFLLLVYFVILGFPQESASESELL
ncbi:MAG: stage II sporulation protein M [Planctomycetota bacterium]